MRERPGRGRTIAMAEVANRFPPVGKPDDPGRRRLTGTESCPRLAAALTENTTQHAGRQLSPSPRVLICKRHPFKPANYRIANRSRTEQLIYESYSKLQGQIQPRRSTARLITKA